MKTYTVYYIQNKWNQKVYIGITNDFEARKSQHFNPNYRQKDKKKILYKAMAVFNEDFFSMEKIIFGLSKEEALIIESYLINTLPTYSPFGYNKDKAEYRMKPESLKKITQKNLDIIVKFMKALPKSNIL